MNIKERKKFWDTLVSLNGDNISSDVDKLTKVIRYPEKLFRYRSVTTNNLEDLRTNRMRFSSANYYDDPFDTFVHIDIEGFKTVFNENLKKDDSYKILEDLVNLDIFSSYKPICFPNSTGEIKVDDIKKVFNNETIKSLLTSLSNSRNMLKNDSWSVCFSEEDKNESLWIKYANMHKGYTLIYNLLDKQPLSFENKGVNDSFKFIPSLYPIYYSNEKYDATEYAKFVIASTLEWQSISVAKKKIPFVDLLQVNKNQVWQRERITLIKKMCHHYDNEWRIIGVAPSEFYPTAYVKPFGIILGLKMEPDERNLVINMAKEAGIDKIYQSFINFKGDLDYGIYDRRCTK